MATPDGISREEETRVVGAMEAVRVVMELLFLVFKNRMNETKLLQRSIERSFYKASLFKA
jgi:hypothetical protein